MINATNAISISKEIYSVLKFRCRVDPCDEVEIEYEIEAAPATSSNPPSAAKSMSLIVGRESLPTKANRKRKLNMSEKSTVLADMQETVLKLECTKIEMETKKLKQEMYKLGLQSTLLEVELAEKWKNAGFYATEPMSNVIQYAKEYVTKTYLQNDFF